MNKLLVVVPYKLWFCSSNMYTTRALLGLQIHALESIFWALWSSNSIILGVAWVEFKLMMATSSGCGLCPSSCSGKVGAYAIVS